MPSDDARPIDAGPLQPDDRDVRRVLARRAGAPRAVGPGPSRAHVLARLARPAHCPRASDVTNSHWVSGEVARQVVCWSGRQHGGPVPVISPRHAIRCPRCVAGASRG